LIIEN